MYLFKKIRIYTCLLGKTSFGQLTGIVMKSMTIRMESQKAGIHMARRNATQKFSREDRLTLKSLLRQILK